MSKIGEFGINYLWGIENRMSNVMATNVSINKNYPIRVCDENGNEMYYEDKNGYWALDGYNGNSKHVYHQDSGGFWWCDEYNEEGLIVKFSNSYGHWYKKRYDENGRMIAYANHNYDWWNKEIMNIDNPYYDNPYGDD